MRIHTHTHAHARHATRHHADQYFQGMQAMDRCDSMWIQIPSASAQGYTPQFKQ